MGEIPGRNLEDKLRRTEANAELGLSSQWERVSVLGPVVNFIRFLAGQFWIERGGGGSNEIQQTEDFRRATIVTEILFYRRGEKGLKRIISRKNK